MTDNTTIELSILRSIPVLQDLDEQDLQALVKRARVINYNSEDVIYEEGEPCNSLWIIISGAVRLLTTAEKDGHEIVTASLESGDFFGDEALQPGYEGRRTATAIATETTTARTALNQNWVPNNSNQSAPQLFRVPHPSRSEGWGTDTTPRAYLLFQKL